MLDQLVIKHQCERCPAVEEVPTTIEEIQAGGVPTSSDRSISVTVDGDVMVQYEYVCNACWSILSAHVADMASQPKKKSSLRKRKSKA